MHRALFPVVLLTLTGVPAGNPAHAVERTHEFQLDNGLQVLVHEDHRAPVVVSQVWYKVGAVNEHDGITGISHALEHMMFKGTDRRGPNEFSRIISSNGGEDNAFTADDYTAYYEKLEKSRLPVSLELEAERMQHLKISAEEFAKERKVIMEERRLRTDDEPESLLFETAMATAFQISPYRHPVIGWMQDIEHLAVDELQAWYKQWYAPNNAILVVAGDVEPQAVQELAVRHFGSIPRGPELPVRLALEPPQNGSKHIVVRAAAELPSVLLAYKVPTLKSVGNEVARQHECFALEVLARILGGGESARLNRRLVRGSQVAAAAGAGYELIARLDTLFTVEATPAHQRSVADLEAAIKKEIQELQNHAVAAGELERIKTETIAGHVYEQDSVYAQAMEIGTLAAVGLDWRLKDRYLEELKSVTAEDVLTAARKYLRPENLTVAILEPLRAAAHEH